MDGLRTTNPSQSKELEKEHWPQNPRGKTEVGQNAITHGLLVAPVLSAGDDPEEFQGLAQAVREHYQPQNAMEEILVHEYTTLLRRLRRFCKAEAGGFAPVEIRQRPAQLVVTGPDPNSIPKEKRALLEELNPGAIDLQASFSARISFFEAIHRYEISLRRELRRCAEELERLQFARGRNADPYYVRHMRRFAPLGENPNQTQEGTEGSFPLNQPENGDLLPSDPVSSRSEETVQSRTEDPNPLNSQPPTPEQPGTASVNTAAEQSHANPTAQVNSDGTESRKRQNGEFAKQSQFHGEKHSGTKGGEEPAEIGKASVIRPRISKGT